MTWFRRFRRFGRQAIETEPGERIDRLPGQARETREGTLLDRNASEPDVEPVGVAFETTDCAQVLADRQALIHLCLYAMDRARSGGVAERIEQGLDGIGVRALRPDGERFDPSLHEAGGAVPVEDPALEGTVAETEMVGFVDHDRLLRAPVVTVYTRSRTEQQPDSRP